MYIGNNRTRTTNNTGLNNIDNSLNNQRQASDIFDINLIDFRPASRRYIFNSDNSVGFSRYDLLDERADFSFADIIRNSLDNDEDPTNSEEEQTKKVILSNLD
jgi:hypothetical protein